MPGESVCTFTLPAGVGTSTPGTPPVSSLTSEAVSWGSPRLVAP